MAIMIVHQGADWNQELYDQTMERVIPDPSNPPDGLIAHFGGPDESGGWRVCDIWESQDQWERFAEETLMPVAQEIQAPPFDSAVGELHNKIVTERVAV
jgi:hypothetical protein